VFLDAKNKSVIAQGSPKFLLQNCENLDVQSFLKRKG